MTTKFTVVLAPAAGFIGGLASHYCVPSSVLAQQGSGGGIPQERTAIPQEIQTHKFLLVDDGGGVRGAFGFNKHGNPDIVLMDVKGHKYGIQPTKFSPELLPDMPKGGSKSK
jgi:hypothetical protein